MAEIAKTAKRVTALTALALGFGVPYAIIRDGSERVPAVCEAIDHNGHRVRGLGSYALGDAVVNYQRKGVVSTRESEVDGFISTDEGRYFLQLAVPLSPDMLDNQYTDFTHTKAKLLLRVEGVGQIGLTEACIEGYGVVRLPIQP